MANSTLDDSDSSCGSITALYLHFSPPEAVVPNIVVAHIKLSAKKPTELMYGYFGINFLPRETSFQKMPMNEKIFRDLQLNRGKMYEMITKERKDIL